MSVRTARVLCSYGPGQPLRAEDAELRAGPGESLIEVQVASVTQLDRKVLAGKVAQQLQPIRRGPGW
jgi:NADPH:quinone reductase-like Zn-dependent oxidoreductase